MDLLKVGINPGKRVVWGALHVGDRQVGVLRERQSLVNVINSQVFVHAVTHAPCHVKSIV